MKVVAYRKGYYKSAREPGSAPFELDDPAHFSERWMRKVNLSDKLAEAAEQVTTKKRDNKRGTKTNPVGASRVLASEEVQALNAEVERQDEIVTWEE